jgi:hypothetical protein
MAEVHLPHGGHEPEATGGPGGSGPRIEHETSDVNIRPILGFLLTLTVACVFISFIVWLLFTFFNVRESHAGTLDYPLATQQENRLPPEPRLQTQPRQDLNDLRAHEDEILTTYGWVDRNAGVARIPIDQAMKTLVERGLPARAGTEPRK